MKNKCVPPVKTRKPEVHKTEHIMTRNIKEPVKRDRRQISAPRGAHAWDNNKRRFIHLIFTELDLGRHDLVTLMHGCFPDMMRVGYNANFKKFWDIWMGKENVTHCKEWWNIARPRPAIEGKRIANNAPYTTAELADFARIRTTIHRIATENHIKIVLKDPHNVELWAIGTIVTPVPQQQFPQAHTVISVFPSLGARLNMKVVASTRHSTSNQVQEKIITTVRVSRKGGQQASESTPDESEESTQGSDEEYVGKEIDFARKSGISRQSVRDAQEGKTLAGRRSLRKGLRGAQLNYVEENNSEGDDDSESFAGDEFREDEFVEFRSKRKGLKDSRSNLRACAQGIKRKASGSLHRTSTQLPQHQAVAGRFGFERRSQRHTPVYVYTEESNEEMGVEETDNSDGGKADYRRSRIDEVVSQEDMAYYDAPISEDGYNLASIRSPRFRNIKTVRQRKPAHRPTALGMVHQGLLSTVELRDGTTIISAQLSQRFDEQLQHVGDYDNADKDAYCNGGAVLRVYYSATYDSPARFADTMICDVTQCANSDCQNFEKPYTYAAMTNSGLPFVHWDDCASDEQGELEFFPDHVNGPMNVDVNPSFIQEASIIFHNGFEKMTLQALICTDGDCQRCQVRKAEREGYQISSKDKEAGVNQDGKNVELGGETEDSPDGRSAKESFFEIFDEESVAAGVSGSSLEDEEDTVRNTASGRYNALLRARINFGCIK